MTLMTDQGGQAVAEACVALGVLASLCLGIAWLGRAQDAALHLSHASRQAAFAWAHQGMSDADLAAQAAADSAAPGQRWQARSGADLLPDGMRVRQDALPDWRGRRPGDPVSGAADMRRELRLGDDALGRILVSARTSGQEQASSGLRDFDDQALLLRRRTVIMRGAGAAADDAAVQDTLGRSEHMWRRAQQDARSVGGGVDRRVQGVDAAWGRARPDWDWLGPWTSQVPARHVQPRSAP